ncbi:hypothetical protein D3C84_1312110 [compost metagenome]
MLDQAVATIHHQHFTGDVAGLRRREKGHSGGDFLGSPGAADGRVLGSMPLFLGG